MHRELRHPVGERRGEAAHPPDQVGVAEKAILEADAVDASLGRSRAEHEAWKVDLPAMRWRVWTVVIAELALIAEVDDRLQVGGREFVDVAVDGLGVDPIEHDLERGAEWQTAPAAAADVVDTTQLDVEFSRLPEVRRPDIEGHGVPPWSFRPSVGIRRFLPPPTGPHPSSLPSQEGPGPGRDQVTPAPIAMRDQDSRRLERRLRRRNLFPGRCSKGAVEALRGPRSRRRVPCPRSG
jgi:hypothetical protein